jgi:hypothetical protein
MHQRDINPRLMRLNERSCSGAIKALATVRLFINCSRRPSEVPRSSFQVANLTAALPVTAAKAMGKIVAAWVLVSCEIASSRNILTPLTACSIVPRCSKLSTARPLTYHTVAKRIKNGIVRRTIMKSTVRSHHH